MDSLWRAFIGLAFVLALIVGVIVAILRLFFVDLATVGHNGMAPTLIAGDEVVIWRNASIARGDVVVCRNPSDESRLVIGRVAGTSGDSLHLDERRRLRINTFIPPVDYDAIVKFYDSTDDHEYTMQIGHEELGGHKHDIFLRERTAMSLRPTKVRDGLFLLGDNRTHGGDDSRLFGEVDPATCLGTVVLRFKPVEGKFEGFKHGWFDIIQ